MDVGMGGSRTDGGDSGVGSDGVSESNQSIRREKR